MDILIAIRFIQNHPAIYYNLYLMPNRDPIVANLSVALAGLCATVAPSMTLITES